MFGYAAMLEKLVETTRTAARTSGFLSWTAVMLAAVNAHQQLVPEERRRAVFEKYMRHWTGTLLELFGAKVAVGPVLPSPSSGARLVVSNHRSPLDIAVILTYFGGSVLSRADLANWPLLGLAARHANTIFVDRDAKTSRSNAVKVIREHLTRGGTVTVFPEGTAYAGDEVRSFRYGAFAAAQGLDVEIFPIGLAYPPGTEFADETFIEHLGRISGRRRTPISLRVGQGRKAFGTPEEMANWSHDQVQQLVHRARTALVA